MRAALHHLRAPRNETVEMVETKARHEVIVLERGLIVLEIITGIAPLLGLIGAVSGLGARFLRARAQLRRVEYAGDRARHRGGVERHGLRTFDRGADADRVQLFLEKGRSHVGRDRNARRGIDQQMLLRPRRPRGGAPPRAGRDRSGPRARPASGLRFS